MEEVAEDKYLFNMYISHIGSMFQSGVQYKYLRIQQYKEQPVAILSAYKLESLRYVGNFLNKELVFGSTFALYWCRNPVS